FPPHRYLRSLPTRRSSDLGSPCASSRSSGATGRRRPRPGLGGRRGDDCFWAWIHPRQICSLAPRASRARNSSVGSVPVLRLGVRSEEHTSNSSHVKISYAV